MLSCNLYFLTFFRLLLTLQFSMQVFYFVQFFISFTYLTANEFFFYSSNQLWFLFCSFSSQRSLILVFNFFRRFGPAKDSFVSFYSIEVFFYTNICIHLHLADTLSSIKTALFSVSATLLWYCICLCVRVCFCWLVWSWFLFFHLFDALLCTIFLKLFFSVLAFILISRGFLRNFFFQFAWACDLPVFFFPMMTLTTCFSFAGILLQFPSKLFALIITNWRVVTPTRLCEIIISSDLFCGFSYRLNITGFD